MRNRKRRVSPASVALIRDILWCNDSGEVVACERDVQAAYVSHLLPAPDLTWKRVDVKPG